MLEDLFKEGHERWIKIKYHDTEKCIKAFRLHLNNEESDKWVRDKGYEVTSISIRDEFIPQVVALSEIKNIIGDNYLNQVDVVQLLENKIEELLRKVTLDSL